MQLAFTNLSLTSALGACFGLASSFVLSLYVADCGLPRDHPRTVRRRILAVSLLSVASPLALCWYANWNWEATLTALGLRRESLIGAILVPLGLVPALYLGPMVQDWSAGEPLLSQVDDTRRDIFLRNCLIAPLAEEVVFRSCMIPLLLPHLGPNWTALIVPLFFGIAHVHHMMEHIRSGSMTVRQAVLVALGQTCYTSLFGMFSAFLFLRTGHLVSAVIAHALCNAYGLPEIWLVRQHPRPILVSAAYLVGLGTFLSLLYVLLVTEYF